MGCSVYKRCGSPSTAPEIKTALVARAKKIRQIIHNSSSDAVSRRGIEESVHPLQAFTIDEFFRAVVEYVYVAPSKLKKFKAQLRKSEEAEEGA